MGSVSNFRLKRRYSYFMGRRDARFVGIQKEVLELRLKFKLPQDFKSLLVIEDGDKIKEIWGWEVGVPFDETEVERVYVDNN